MPRVRPLGGIDYNKKFRGELEAARKRLFLNRDDTGDKIGCSDSTVRNYELEPPRMTLGYLKKFIKITSLEPNVILEYLYEGKYNVRIEPK